MTDRHPARYSSQVARTIRSMPGDVRKALHVAVQQAEADPLSFPQADRYDLDTTVRIIVTDRAILHYAILPEPPHLWVFAALLL